LSNYILAELVYQRVNYPGVNIVWLVSRNVTTRKLKSDKWNVKICSWISKNVE